MLTNLEIQMLAHDPTRRITRNAKRINDCNETSFLLNMPTEVILQISDSLDVLDRAGLALSCKDLAAKLSAHNHLDWDGTSAHACSYPERPDSDPLVKFFRERLANGWIPATLKYCTHCGKYGPKDDTEYWLNRLRKEFVGKHGNLSRFIEGAFLTDSEVCTYGLYLKHFEDLWQFHLHEACPRCQVLFGYWRLSRQDW